MQGSAILSYRLSMMIEESTDTSIRKPERGGNGAAEATSPSSTRADGLSHRNPAGTFIATNIQFMTECRNETWPFTSTPPGWGGTFDHGRVSSWDAKSYDGVAMCGQY